MVNSISAEKLKLKLDNGDNFVLIDCRAPEKWQTGYIYGAINLPEDICKNSSNELEIKTKDEIIVYCTKGRQSIRTCFHLVERNFANITTLEKGIEGWKSMGYEIILPDTVKQE